MRAPEFWRRDGLVPAVLAPLGYAYGAAARARSAVVRPWRAPVPVVCVGNLTVGGAGKTPIVIALCAWLRERGRAPHVLSRGYGGRLAGPVRVDPARHMAAEVGDEALLLAAAAPTWIARDRVAGARAAAAGCDVLLLDDGHQNPALMKDVSLVAVDGGYGFGNRRLIPAGPLREPIARGLARADAAVLVGEDAARVSGLLGGGPVLRARLVPGPEAEALRGRRVLAFAGIGRPQKFFRTLAEAGADLVGRRAFADHHPYRPAEIAALCREAEALGAVPVTTEKDAARLPAELRERIGVVTVHLEWEAPERLGRVLGPALGLG